MVEATTISTLMKARVPKDELVVTRSYAFIFHNWKFTALRQDLEKKQIDYKVGDLN
jgi:hypothetical protein